MRRMHIHVGVSNLDQAIDFYSALFGAQPAKTKSDYAKWMLEDPRMNFAISTREGPAGLNHLGLQVDDSEELTELRSRLETADMSLFDEGETLCCYARSEKTWVEDPAGIAWEAFNTMEDVQFFDRKEDSPGGACCQPAAGTTAQKKPSNKPAACCSS